jgi:hypothetical protein
VRSRVPVASGHGFSHALLRHSPPELSQKSTYAFVWFAQFNHFFESSLLTGAKEQSGKSCNAEEEGSSLGVRESRQGRELTLVLALNCLPTD